MSDKTDIVERLRAWADTICTIRGEVTPGSKSRMALDAADEIERLRAELAQRTAELAALKANDPLAEMWRELSEYQPMADADGHGESWRIMCEERTEEAAWAAYMARQGSSHVRAAAYCAWQQAQRDATARRLSKDAGAWTASAIDAIRRAKEGA
jgi:hypothetical protein